jgi:amidase
MGEIWIFRILRPVVSPIFWCVRLAPAYSSEMPTHARAMGNCGTGVEFPTHTTIHVNLIKDWGINWPRLENEQVIMAIGSARPLEDAVRIAYRELVFWMEKEYGFDRWDAYMLLTECGIVRLGNFVDPKYSVGASVSKNYLLKA